MDKIRPLFCCFAILLSSCAGEQKIIVSNKEDEKIIQVVLDDWHKAAADANFTAYFNLMSSDAVFIGTDPTENWQLVAFKAFSKPYFDKGKAWSFISVDRHIYLHSNDIAWFDELLSTQMKLCRGSGVLKKENGKWKIAHYVLSITIPNENTDDVIRLKTNFDNRIIDSLKRK